MDFVDAKKELSTYKWKLIDIATLNSKIETLSASLASSTSSVIKIMIESNKELTEKYAELYDLQTRALDKRLEAERYNEQLEYRIAGLKHPEFESLLKLRYLGFHSYRYIGNHVGYNEKWIQKKIIAATRIYADLYDTTLYDQKLNVQAST